MRPLSLVAPVVPNIANSAQKATVRHHETETKQLIRDLEKAFSRQTGMENGRI